MTEIPFMDGNVVALRAWWFRVPELVNSDLCLHPGLCGHDPKPEATLPFYDQRGADMIGPWPWPWRTRFSFSVAKHGYEAEC